MQMVIVTEHTVQLDMQIHLTVIWGTILPLLLDLIQLSNTNDLLYMHVCPYSNKLMNESKWTFLPDITKFPPGISEI